MVIAALLLSYFVWAAPCSETRAAKIVEVSKTEYIPGDLSVACKALKMDGQVEGDLLAGGMYLNIGNSVGGDVTAGGYSIELQGTFGDDVRLAGANIQVDGTVEGDLVAFGGSVKILGDVTGDVITGGGNVWIHGNIQGSLDARCGYMVIAGTIGQGAVVTASKLSLSPAAVLKGDLIYTSSDDAYIPEGAQIAGEVDRESNGKGMFFWKLASALAQRLPERPESWEEWKESLPLWFRTLLRISSFVSLLIAGIIVLIIYERHTTMVADRIMSFPLKTLVWGIAILVCVPVGALILCTTVVGLPVGIVILLTYLIFCYISRVYVALAIGREILDRITERDVRIVWPMILGLLIITLLSSIPYYVGWVIRFICVLFGLGGMLMIERRLRIASREDVT